jgi:protocatechuate 3,4-dioxygenase beta subunit
MSSTTDLGVYSGEDPRSAAYASFVQNATSLLGATPTILSQGIDYTKPMSTWVAQFQSAAAIAAAAPGGTSNTPDLSVPMVAGTSNSVELQTLQAIASGADDSIWLGIVQAYAAEGFTTIYMRPGWEMEGNWFTWSVQSETMAAAYIAAFDRISTIAHSVAGINVQIVWDPGSTGNAAIPVQDMYPGDAYVDVVGLDFYDVLYPYSLHDWATGGTDTTIQQWWSNPVNLAHYWDYPDSTGYAPEGGGNEWGLVAALTFAAAHDKPFALPETGDEGNGTTTGPLSDPYFPQYLAERLLAAGAPSLAFVNIWDKYGTSSQFTEGANPVMAAAWAQFVKEINQDDAGPTIADPASITVGNNQTTNLLAALQALVTPGRTGDTETISGVSAGSGTVTLGAGGAVLYVAGAAGKDTLTFTVTDQLGDSETGTVTLVIDPGPTIKTAAVKVAHGQTFTLASLAASLVTPGETGDTETFSNVTSANGIITVLANGTIQYTPPASGTDTLSYTVTDQLGDSVTGSSTIDVDPGPILSAGVITATPGQVESLTNTLHYQITPGLAGDTETITAISALTGTVKLSNGAVTYTAPASGTDTLTFTVTDQFGETATGTSTVVVNPGGVQGKALLFGGSNPAYGSGDPGVTVTLLTSSGVFVASMQSSNTGYYHFTALVAGNYEVEYTPPLGQGIKPGTAAISAPFYVAPSTTATAPQGSLITLASITGTVQYAGTGQADVTVSLFSSSDTSTVLATTTTTSGTGGFTFYDLAAGSYVVQYTSPATKTLSSGPAASGTGLTPVITLTTGQAYTLAAETLVTALGSITGSIVGTGLAVSNLVVTLLDAAGTQVATTSTDSSGNFAFQSLTPGTYQVQYPVPQGSVVQSGGPANAAGLDTSVVVTAGQTTTLAAEQLLSLGSITGSIVEAGAGVAGLTVTLLSASGVQIGTAVTDANGNFVFSNLVPATYQVQYPVPQGTALQAGGPANAAGVDTSVVVTAGQMTALAIEQLLSLGSITGSIVEAGAGVANLTVTLLNSAGTQIATAVTDGSGDFTFSNLTPGTYQVQYPAPQGTSLQSGGPANSAGLDTSVVVTAGQTTALAAEQLLATPGNIIGVVLHLGGATDPAWGGGDYGVTVSLLNAAGGVVATTTTQSNGWYIFRYVTPGTYQVSAAVPVGQAVAGGGSGVDTGVVVVGGATVSAPFIYMVSTAGSIAGSIVEGGVGQAGLTVTLLSSSGSALSTATTDANGNFVFSSVVAGSYQVQYPVPQGTVLQTGGPANAGAVATSVTVSSGQTTTLAPEQLLTNPSSLSGTIAHLGGATDPGWGSGDPGVTVSLLDSSGNVLATTTTDGNGWYIFRNLGPGTYQISDTPPAGQLVAPGRSSVESGLVVGAGVSVGAWPLYLVSAVTTSAAVVTTAAAQVVTSSPQPTTNTATLSGTVAHLGGISDPAWGSGDPGATVSLLDSAGNVLATTTTNWNGWYCFYNLAAGTYQISAAPPAGQEVAPGHPAVESGIVVAAGASAAATPLYMVSAVTMNGSGLSVTEPDGGYYVTGNASNSTLTLGAGNQNVTLTGTADTVVTGNGDENITLAGTGNSVTVGTGTSSINAGSGDEVVHAAGGTVSITAGGGGNLFDAGTGMGYLYADGSSGNTFLLNAGGSAGLTTIAGFNVVGDTLDLTRTLAGTGILPDLSNLGSYVTATVSGSNTTLLVDPTGGSGTPQAFAVLSGVQTSIAALLAANEFALT